MKLALGTVQFGLDYGVSNDLGQVSPKEIEEILATALSYGIKTLDSAAAYGTSELILGKNNLSQEFTLVTKIPAIERKQIELTKLLKQSLTKLKRNKVQTVLLHNADDLITHPKRDEIYQQLVNLKKLNLTDKIGVSVYSPTQLEQIIEKYAIDTVQLPINLFDQRFLKKNLLEKLQRNNITVHARSVFLQGLLLMDQASIPDYFQPYQVQLQAFYQLAKQLNCNKITLALALVVQNPFINNIVIGCCSKTQLDEIVTSYHKSNSLDLSLKTLKTLASEELNLIIPSLWCLDD